MRKLNEKEIRTMSAYMSRCWGRLYREGGAHEDRKEEYKAKQKVMFASKDWFEIHNEITSATISDYVNAMEEVLGTEEHTDEYKAGWHEAVKEVEGFMKWMLEWHGIGED